MSDPIRELIELIDSTLALTPRTGTDDYPGGVTEGMHIALGIVREKAAALSTTPAPLNLLAEWALDDPWEKGDHVLDSEEDFFCVGCGTRAPFTYDRDQPDWWKQTPNPQIGHDADCLWVRSRTALEGATP